MEERAEWEAAVAQAEVTLPKRARFSWGPGRLRRYGRLSDLPPWRQESALTKLLSCPTIPKRALFRVAKRSNMPGQVFRRAFRSFAGIASQAWAANFPHTKEKPSRRTNGPVRDPRPRRAIRRKPRQTATLGTPRPGCVDARGRLCAKIALSQSSRRVFGQASNSARKPILVESRTMHSAASGDISKPRTSKIAPT